MESTEFHERTRSTFEQLRTRIDEQWWGGIELELAGGEYARALEDIIDIVAEDGIPVTEAELESLRALARCLHDDAKWTAMLEQVRPQ
jgi:hypothetical protein